MISLKNILREIIISLISFLGNLFFLLSKKPKIDPAKVKKILILKIYALGDLVYCQPMVPNLQANFPQAKIIWVVGKYSRTIVEHMKGVDEIIEWQGLKTARIIQAKKIDLAFSLYRSPFSHLFLWWSKVPIRVGFNWRGRGFALTHKIQFRGDILESDRYLMLIEDLGLEIKERRRSLVVNPEEKKMVSRKLADFSLDDKKRPIVALVPGGGDNPQLLMPMKRWDPNRFGAVADYLAEHHQAQIVLIGAPSEKELAEKVANSAISKVINLVAQTELDDLVPILSLFDLVIACDTGPLHIATALKIPTIGLFGPSDPNLVAQVGPLNLIIRKDNQEPIYTPDKVFARKFAGTNADPVHQSMLAIQVEDVTKAIDSLLS